MSQTSTSNPRPARPRSWVLWLAAGLPFLATLVLLALLGLGERDVPVAGRWLGRFHMVVLHFPIALLALALLLEFSRLPVGRWFLPQASTPVIALVLGLGAASAWGAAVCGWLLALGGDYDPGLLGRHFYAGLFTAAAALLALVLRLTLHAQHRAPLRALYGTLLVLANAGVILTGHVGGSLTHGQHYLTEFAPGPLRSLLGLPPGQAPRRAEPGSPANENDPAFASQLQPILDAKCVECHNPQKAKGKLRLDSYAELLKGGGNGPVVVPGQPGESELLRRVELPPDDEDFMPPQGKPPLTGPEVALLRAWIQAGAEETTASRDLGVGR